MHCNFLDLDVKHIGHNLEFHLIFNFDQMADLENEPCCFAC